MSEAKPKYVVQSAETLRRLRATYGAPEEASNVIVSMTELPEVDEARVAARQEALREAFRKAESAFAE